MRTERFSSALLSTLIAISLTAPAITLLSVSSATPTSAQANYTIIVRGKENAYSGEFTESGDPPAYKLYAMGELPPIVAAERKGEGAVIALGLSATLWDNRWNNENNPHKDFDDFLDVAFQWGKSGAKKVLWHTGYGTVVKWRADTDPLAYMRANAIQDNLRALGYDVTEDNTTPITTSLLASYDILLISGYQLGARYSGGDPTQLPDNDVDNIVSWVNAGGVLVIFNNYDTAGYNFFRVHNKILKALDFSWFFQSDTIFDNVDNWGGSNRNVILKVDTTTAIGSVYQSRTGVDNLGVYNATSLASVVPGVEITISPGYRMGLAGGTLSYTVKVMNTGAEDDTYNLTVSDNASPSWNPTISPTLLPVPAFGENYAVLSVTIPSWASIGDSDNITVVATSQVNAEIKDNKWCLAIADTRIKPTTADAHVIEGMNFENRNWGKETYAYVGSSATAWKDERVFLKFDLRAMGTAIGAIENVRLYVYKFRLSGAPDKSVELRRVDNDNWDELEINWTNQPSYGGLIGTASMPDEDIWYSWDVKDYVLEQYSVDKIASFCMKAANEGLSFPDNFSYGFSTKEYGISGQHPYLATGARVWTRIVQRYQVGMRGGTISYRVLVQNVGALHDTYSLTVSDNASPSWSPTISPSSLTLAPGAFGFATVTVTIPGDAPIGENIDNITVVATSTVDGRVSDNYWCTVSVSDNTIMPPVDDSTVKEKEPVSNIVWGTDDTIYVGRYYGGPERGFLKFDLSAIPSGTNIARARLWLNAFRVDNAGLVVPVVQVRSVANDAWVERGAGRLMWNNQPSIGDVLDVRAVIENRKYYWDVTSFVQAQFAGDKVASFALINLGENIAPDHRARFTSKEYVARGNHPYLEILTAPPEREVRVYISPVFQGGENKDNLVYTVTVKNMGTVEDTYTLTVDDNLGWGATISPTSLTLPAGASGNATLKVVPRGTICTINRITVIAAGTNVNDSATCFAHTSKATFKLENLTKVSVDMNLRLRDDAAKLVVRFYTYADALQGERVVWSIMPWHLENKENIIHPLNNIDYPVQKAKLLLVDASGAEIQMVKDFIVRRMELGARVAEIRLAWRGATSAERTLMGTEVAKIRLIWRGTPT